jgi:hypothetical protein
MIDPTTHLNQFLEGVRLLGGHRAAGSILDINERTMRRICAADQPLHAGFLRDLAAALLDRANHCHELERQIVSSLQDDPAETSSTL